MALTRLAGPDLVLLSIDTRTRIGEIRTSLIGPAGPTIKHLYRPEDQRLHKFLSLSMSLQDGVGLNAATWGWGWNRVMLGATRARLNRFKCVVWKERIGMFLWSGLVWKCGFLFHLAQKTILSSLISRASSIFIIVLESGCLVLLVVLIRWFLHQWRHNNMTSNQCNRVLEGMTLMSQFLLVNRTGCAVMSDLRANDFYELNLV